MSNVGTAMKELPQNVSGSTRKRNPHLYATYEEKEHAMGKNYMQEFCGPKPPTRIRQSQKPLMNKLEQEWYDSAKRLRFKDSIIVPQGVKLRLANGVWIVVDFFVMVGGFDSQDRRPRAIDVKGPQEIQDDAVVKLKVAAKEYQWIKWSIEWKENGGWQEQTIYP